MVSPHARKLAWLFLVVLLVLFGVFVWPTRHAYYPLGGLLLARVNRLTGHVDFILGDVVDLRKPKPPEIAPSSSGQPGGPPADNPRRFTTEDLDRLHEQDKKPRRLSIEDIDRLFKQPGGPPADNPIPLGLLDRLDEWWIPEYPALIRAVQGGANRTLRTMYRTGPAGEAEVRLTLIRKSERGLIVSAELPPQAIVSVDPKTGQKIPGTTRPVITVRDHDEDGLPDDFKLEPSGGPSPGEKRTKDGFIIFRHDPEHRSIWAHWTIAVGFSVNHFLHGVDSALPRK